MSRRNRGGNPISLFAFQDIITSVSGIFIVMVLLLTLELVERSTAETPAMLDKSLVENVREAIVRAEGEIADLKRIAAQDNDLMRIAIHTTPEEVTDSIAARQRDISRLKASLQESQKQAEQLAENARATAVEHFDLRDERKELEQLERDMAELQQQLESEEQSDRPVFTLPRGLDKQGWLAVLDAEEIQMAPIGRSAPMTIFQNTSGLLRDSTAADGLMDWVGEQDLESLYLFVLVRPQGIATFDTLQGKLELRNIAFGFDLIEQNQEILHPERGAAP